MYSIYFNFQWKKNRPWNTKVTVKEKVACFSAHGVWFKQIGKNSSCWLLTNLPPVLTLLFYWPHIPMALSGRYYQGIESCIVVYRLLHYTVSIVLRCSSSITSSDFHDSAAWHFTNTIKGQKYGLHYAPICDGLR